MKVNWQKDIKVVVDCIIANPHLTDERLTSVLKEKGLDESFVPSYLIWIPIAFCRFMLQGEIEFPAYYQSYDSTTKTLNRKSYSEHLLFQEATKYAEIAVAKGLRGDNFVAVAGRSAEFHAINQMDLLGSKLENIVLTEARIVKTAFDDQVQKKKRFFWW